MEITPTFWDCWFLTGATASGKTDVGICLAELLDAEIIALDSMTVYRAMDIGTAKPSADDRRRVVHHLVDIRDPDDEYSLANYVEDVARTVASVRSRGKNPLFVGGTPLYLKSLLRGIFRGPPADWGFRESIRQEIADVGTEALYRRLQQVDPITAAKLPENDVRRLIRALEVYKVTGRPISHWQLQFDEGHSAEECRVFVLQWPRDMLRERILRRVEHMFDVGLVEEVRQLVATYSKLSRTAAQAVGYREVLDYLSGRSTLDDARTRTTSRTRQFAKRQETWFRGLSECRLVQRREVLPPETLAREIAWLGRQDR